MSFLPSSLLPQESALRCCLEFIKIYCRHAMKNSHSTWVKDFSQPLSKSSMTLSSSSSYSKREIEIQNHGISLWLLRHFSIEKSKLIALLIPFLQQFVVDCHVTWKPQALACNDDLSHRIYFAVISFHLINCKNIVLTRRI